MTRPHRHSVPAAGRVLGRRGLLLGGALVAAGVLTGCTEQGPNAGEAVLSVGGTIAEWPAKARPAAVTFEGETETGDTFSSSSLTGRVAVVNFWYAGCAPCRAEAADLPALWLKYRDQDVQFLGVNTRDSRGAAEAFTGSFGITYPSILDQAGDSTVQLAFSGTVSLKAVPTTLVLDRQGEVASRILGKIPGRNVLDTLIQGVLAEKT